MLPAFGQFLVVRFVMPTEANSTFGRDGRTMTVPLCIIYVEWNTGLKGPKLDASRQPVRSEVICTGLVIAGRSNFMFACNCGC